MSPDEIDSLCNETLKGLILSLLERIDALMAENKALKARSAELQSGKPSKTLKNSSVPPSSGKKSRAPGKKKGRRTGRPGVTREVCPNPDVTRDSAAYHVTTGLAAAKPNPKIGWGAKASSRLNCGNQPPKRPGPLSPQSATP